MEVSLICSDWGCRKRAQRRQLDEVLRTPEGREIKAEG